MTGQRCLSDLAIFTVEYDFDIHYERKVDKFATYTEEPHQVWKRWARFILLK